MAMALGIRTPLQVSIWHQKTVEELTGNTPVPAPSNTVRQWCYSDLVSECINPSKDETTKLLQEQHTPSETSAAVA